MDSQSAFPGFVACLMVLILAGTLVTAEGVENQTVSNVSNLTNNSVLITNFAFEPNQLNISVNSSVIWTNEDAAPHNIVSDKGAPEEIKSDLFSKGQSFEFNFTKAGLYPYHCGVHPAMTGTIRVAA